MLVPRCGGGCVVGERLARALATSDRQLWLLGHRGVHAQSPHRHGSATAAAGDRIHPMADMRRASASATLRSLRSSPARPPPDARNRRDAPPRPRGRHSRRVAQLAICETRPAHTLRPHRSRPSCSRGYQGWRRPRDPCCPEGAVGRERRWWLLWWRSGHAVAARERCSDCPVPAARWASAMLAAASRERQRGALARRRGSSRWQAHRRLQADGVKRSSLTSAPALPHRRARDHGHPLDCLHIHGA